MYSDPLSAYSPTSAHQIMPTSLAQTSSLSTSSRAVTHPQSYRSMNIDCVHANLPLTPSRTSFLVPALPSPLPSPRARSPDMTSALHSPRISTFNYNHNHSPGPQQQYTLSTHQAAPASMYNLTNGNEATERHRLEAQRVHEAQELTRRRDSLRKDPNAIYHSYAEVLEHFPLPRGERPNPYLVGLLANQTLPVEPTSDRALAIRFAKKHWENYWEVKDLQYVIIRAKRMTRGGRKKKVRYIANARGH